jgi:hypothetical protein
VTNSTRDTASAAASASRPRDTRGTDSRLVGHIPVHAMRCSTPKAGDAHLQGQIAEHGQMGQRAGGCKDRLAGRLYAGADRCRT